MLRVGVAKADLDTQGRGQCDGSDCFEPFGVEREQNEIVAGKLSQLVNVIGHGIHHKRPIMSAAKTGFIRQKWAFDVPACNSGLEQGRLGAQFAIVLQAVEHLLPFVGNQREEKSCASGLQQPARGAQQVVQGDVVLLKIDSGEAVDLQIHQRRSDPAIRGRWFGRLDEKDSAVLPMDANRLARRVMPGVDLSFVHAIGALWSAVA